MKKKHHCCWREFICPNCVRAKAAESKIVNPMADGVNAFGGCAMVGKFCRRPHTHTQQCSSVKARCNKSTSRMKWIRGLFIFLFSCFIRNQTKRLNDKNNMPNISSAIVNWTKQHRQRSNDENVKHGKSRSKLRSNFSHGCHCAHVPISSSCINRLFQWSCHFCFCGDSFPIFFFLHHFNVACWWHFVQFTETMVIMHYQSYAFRFPNFFLFFFKRIALSSYFLLDG